MNRERPVVVLVFAILNIVFGSLGSLCSICTGIMTFVAQSVMTAAGPAMPGPPIPSDVIAMSIGQCVIQFFLSVPLIFAGIGLLGMKAWARSLCIVLSILGILYSLLSPAITIGYTQPRMQAWQKDLQEQLTRQQQRQGVQQPPMFFQTPQSRVLNTIGAVVVPTLVLAYAVALLVAMLNRQVSAAFAGRPIRQRVDWDQEPEDTGAGR